MINDFKFPAYYCLCYVSYIIEAYLNTLIWYGVRYLYYKSLKFSFWLSIWWFDLLGYVAEAAAMQRHSSANTFIFVFHLYEYQDHG